MIIVGAGPAGSAAAYSLAKNGHQVLILERGKEPGSKNVYGGRIYPYSLSKLIPDFADDAPIERNITKESIRFISINSIIDIFIINTWSYFNYCEKGRS